MPLPLTNGVTARLPSPFEASGRTEGVVFVGRAQEKNRVFRTERRRDREGRTYPWIVKTTGIINQWYFYCVDEDFGPFFLKFCSYFPYNAKLCLNGHEWAETEFLAELVRRTCITGVSPRMARADRAPAAGGRSRRSRWPWPALRPTWCTG